MCELDIGEIAVSSIETLFLQVRNICQDQWRSARQHSRSVLLVQNGIQTGTNGISVPSIGSPEPSPGPGHNGTPPIGEESRVRGRRRMANLLLNKLITDKAQFISDKGGVSITSDHDLSEGKIHFCVEGVQEYVVRMFVENSGASPVQFIYYSALHFISFFALEDQHKVTRNNPLHLGPGERYEIRVRFRSRVVGCYPATLAFEFKADLQPHTKAFHIVRFLEARFQTSLSRELAPTAPYRPRSIMALNTQPYNVEDGVPPDCVSVQRLKSVVPLKDYKVPPHMTHLIKFLNGFTAFSFQLELLEAKALLESPLSWDNYSKRFQLLLYLEELQMEVDIKRYNMKEAPMVRDKRLLVLEVPGVSENRPSVLRGDQLLVRPSRPADVLEEGVKYRGYVHRVELEKVKLGFSHKLCDKIFIDNMKFDVEFIVNRLTMRIQQRAAELASQHGLRDVLFPTGATISSQATPLPSLRFFDRQLEQNPEQYKAVQSILAGSSRPAPYLVFGPPGTGKTVTLVEAIKQVEVTQSSSHILACAPSNSAADLLCKKILQHVDPHKVYRMYASSRYPGDVPAEILNCCNLELDGETFVFPSREELVEYKIIVTTLLTAGRLVTGGIPQGHFSHVFIDEAGHAVETECIIPLAGLLQPASGQVVLAGDPKQLGPILRSPLVLKSGMGLSLLERLMKDVCLYQKDEAGLFNTCFVTKLLRNYRSNPAILKIPNELFYDGELQVFADEILRNSYCRWEHLPRTGFPVIFHGVAGRDEREANSPSFFNTAEVVELMEYLKKLFQSQGKKGLATIAPKDIGIIAPYRKQVEKIRKALKIVEKELKIMAMKDLKVLIQLQSLHLKLN
ncbi:putative helicase mov-10-B.1 [Aplochiton taeniatus]